jgi:soluble P-type ATPase
MVRVQLEAELAAQDVVAQEAGGARFFQRFFEALVLLEDFAVDVVVADGDAHGVAPMAMPSISACGL